MGRLLNNLRICAVMLTALVIVVGCAKKPAPIKPANLSQSQAYRLDQGDQTRIIIFGESDLSNTYAVDQSGIISFPLIGPVNARGLTLAELEAVIAQKLGAQYLRSPDVSAEITVFRPFFISGEVRSPGQFPYVPGMTVEMAVAIAGGFTRRADRRVVEITRRYNDEILRGRVPLTDPVQPSDSIFVRAR